MNSNEIVVSLDIGTSSVKVIIGEMLNESLNIIGVGNVKSEGLKKGSIVDIDETVHSIKRAIDQAERMIGLTINRVVVGVNGNHVQLQDCHGIVAVSSENREITDEDVARVIDSAQVVSIPPDREIIGVIPKQFIVDGLDGISDPRGMIGVRLEMEGTMITGAKTVLHNLLRCVERAGLEISDICLQPLAAGSLALSKDEKNLGVALVDIGGGSTTVAIFEQGFLRATAVLPVGGDHITKDISIGLRTSTEDAEKIKLKHGHAFYDLASEEEIFSVPIIGTDQHQQFTQLDVADIIEARLEEIFQLIFQETRKLGFRDLPGGYVLTGGVANMPGILELAQDMLGNSVRIAIPDYIGVRDPQYTTGVGLIKFAYRHAKLQGRGVPVAATVETPEKRLPKQQPSKAKQKSKDENLGQKMKKFFGYFFE
ncbi:cell division protein FtsA [Anoxybacillus sp. B7M1]|jgi:cell division protein FtsA|uniref:Cell division protein FtsA n=1 Tax=Anoxybacteroides rupiense TaxID=311460 RepID=A0ABD5IQ53_9BACL|nr:MULTISPECIES: cell division protein FtsA [Anoxybacillus]ANB59000.1 cell division protein FtsA [Anoxybacillus sp. B2M1]ANB62534.1 cell division protein FtsA [Anoxybacillus sp. B7M1]KXG10464.1 Cell division protein FtsA [Anoxybacillus sp. P3H1B]MBB3906252.1 cell division protein FtsA [Anoxybacillus rupiensis]MBS2770764.1 cell division protein FtsA [Anoxybacillus rupiensis]